MPGVSVGIEGMGPLLRKLNRVKTPIRPLMRKAVNVGRKHTRLASKPHPGDVGAFTKGKHIRVKVSRGEIPEEGKVFTFSPVVEAVASGRKRGSRPSSKAMARWAERHGIPAKKGFALASAIAQHGSEGVEMFTKGRDVLEQRLPGLLQEAAAKIEGDFNRG
ncbi:hypothetical protein LCGC14_1212370 [marine sediment metagenome]|uniref:Uncharacterized protein n=1 Tax=marine sediment metagenome TaxID=412755 RepID=A0A0F9LHZ8_9ZZZZ